MDQYQKCDIQNPPEFYEADLVTQIIHHHGDDKSKQSKFINEYQLKESMGQGSFGKVKRVTRQFKETEDGQLQYADYAMKIFNRSILQNQRHCFYEDNGKTPRMTTMLEFAYSEINIWKYLCHPNICKLFQIIDDNEDPKDWNLGPIMEYDEETNQFKRSQKVIEYIKEKFNVQTKENVAKIIFKQCALAIEYFHSLLIVNRDIKVDNIVCSSIYDNEESIKLIDFSTARQLQNKDTILYDCAGTLGFRSPEQQFSLEEGYLALKCDIWSFGICLFTYLNEEMPFWAESEIEIDIKAKNNPLPFKQDNSEPFKDLVNKCCAKIPQERLSIEQILQHPWFIL